MSPGNRGSQSVAAGRRKFRVYIYLKNSRFFVRAIFLRGSLQFCSVSFGKEKTPTQEPSVSFPNRQSRPTIVQRKQAKSSRRERQPRRNVPSKAQRLAWLHEADAYVVGLVRRVTTFDGLCDADVDDIVQAVRIRLLDDLERFDPSQGTLQTFVRLRCLWEAKAYRRRQHPLSFNEEESDELAPDADELFEHNQWEAMIDSVVDDVREFLPPLEADAVLTLAKVHSVDDVMKKHGVKRRWVQEKRKAGLAKLRKPMEQKWGLK